MINENLGYVVSSYLSSCLIPFDVAATKSECNLDELNLERGAPRITVKLGCVKSIICATLFREHLSSVEYQLFEGFRTERCERHAEERCTW